MLRTPRTPENQGTRDNLQIPCAPVRGRFFQPAPPIENARQAMAEIAADFANLWGQLPAKQSLAATSSAETSSAWSSHKL